MNNASILIPALSAALLTSGISAADSQSGARTLKGEIKDFTTLTLRNDQGERQRGIVRITLENGRQAIVDLGDRRDVKNLGLDAGDRIRVSGSKTRINGKPVLQARRLDIQDAPQLRRNRSGNSASVTFVGTLVHGKKIDDGHLILVDLPNDRQALVQVPNSLGLSDEKLRQAEGVRITGEKRDKGGRSYVKAESLALEGTNTALAGKDRSDQADVASITGTVSGIERVRSGQSATGKDVLIASVTLQDGTDMAVDFGLVGDAVVLDLDEGDQVHIQGVMKDRGGPEVLVAHRIAIRHGVASRQARRTSRLQAGSGDVRSILAQGVVDNVETTTVDTTAGSDERTMLHLTMQDGSKQTVAVKPVLVEQALSLSSGDHIVIQGSERTIEDRSVLMAERILVIEDARSTNAGGQGS